jgi:preprotein translocase subunit SecA
MYELDVVVIPTNRLMIRVDQTDVIFPTQADKERALIREIAEVHRTGRPILVGTASVSESERLSARLSQTGVLHEVLNARDNELESQIVAKAGALGAVTVSTNMAGRGTDIPLEGDRVRELGGLYVIGTNRHESRRIDHQLRGRAGRQGDPGSSRFFLSLEDDLMQRYGVADFLSTGTAGSAMESVQRLIESENLEIRSMLWKYEKLQEQQRRVLNEVRSERLEAGAPAEELNHIDNLWADYLAQIAELRDGLCWIALGGRDPFPDYLRSARDLFDELLRTVNDWSAGDEEIEHPPVTRGATWTYLIKDQPFGTMTERMFAGIQRRIKDALRRAS